MLGKAYLNMADKYMASLQNHLKLADFTLLGHDAPYGDYPAPVIPVGRIGTLLVAVYPGGSEGPAIEVLGDCEIIRYAPETRQRLSGFDPSTERLFAFSDADVRRYVAAEERAFLQQLLVSAEFEACEGKMRQLFAERIAELASTTR